MEYMLTTIDNPHSPFTDYEAWLAYDERQGHYTNSLLARVAVMSADMSEADQEFVIDEAMNEIVKENVSGLYVKVARESEKV